MEKGLIFTYLLTFGGAAASLVNPFVGLLIYVSFAILKPEALWHWSVPAGNYSRILAVAFLVGWAAHGFGNWNFGRAKPIVWCLLGFWGWMILSAAFAPDVSVAWSTVESQSKVFLPIFVGMTLIDSAARLKQLAWVTMLSQGYLAFEFNLSYLQGFNRVKEAGFAGMDNNCISIAMATGAGLALFLGMGERIWWRRWGCFAIAAMMAHVPMFGMSRGGMLGLIVAGVVAFYLIPKSPKHLALFALAVVVGLTMAGPSARDRFFMTFVDREERDASAQNRIDFWGYCWNMMKAEPVFGVGPHHYPMTAKRLYGRGGEAHSLWLQTGAELGFPGLGFLAAFYGIAAWRMWRLLRDSSDPDGWPENTARMVIVSLSGFAVSASFVSLTGLELPYFVVLLAAGMLKVRDQLESDEVVAPIDDPVDEDEGWFVACSSA